MELQIWGEHVGARTIASGEKVVPEASRATISAKATV